MEEISHYWDSSAIVRAIVDSDIRLKMGRPGQATRRHSLSEVFSTLTGGRLSFRMDQTLASEIIREVASELIEVDLTLEETLGAMDRSRSLGVRGARIHDHLHAVAADKAGAKVLLTENIRDFSGLVPGLTIQKP